MKNKNPRIENVRDMEHERQKEMTERGRVYVDSEGKPWRKDKYDKFHRIGVERK